MIALIGICKNPNCCKEFVVESNAQKYCSPECRRRAQYLFTTKVKRAAMKVRKFTCAWCGKDFLSDRKRKYCCKAHRLMANGRLKYEPRNIDKPKEALSIEQVAKLSREAGLSYGQYVQKYDV